MRSSSSISRLSFATLTSELNGMPRESSIAATRGPPHARKRAKAELSDPMQIGAPIPGMVASIGVTVGHKVAKGDKLHPLQQNFIAHAALQCGICTPGFLIAAKALLDKNPDPTEEEIRFGLAGNLCRCTGYDKIVRAVQATAKEMRGA